jgi:DNA repair photolyase
LARDLDVLGEVKRRHYLTVAITITTLDADLARLLEPLAPRPELRLAAVRRLTDAGIDVRVTCAPILPWINDAEASLDRVVSAAAEAGARGVWGNVVFFKPCAQAVFLPFLESRFPELAARYRERFAHRAYLRGAYPEIVKERLDRIRRLHGLDRRAETPRPELWPRQTQMDLFGQDRGES